MTTSVEIDGRIDRSELTKFLSQIARDDSSGCLQINSTSASWNIYFQGGLVRYICCSVQAIEELKYYLLTSDVSLSTSVLEQIPASLLSSKATNANFDLYGGVVCWWMAESKLATIGALKLLRKISEDNLCSCLTLPSSQYSWQKGVSVPKWFVQHFGNLSGSSVTELLSRAAFRFKKMQSFKPYVASVYQRPYFTSGWEQKPLPLNGSLDHKVLKELSKLIRGRTSIRQLSLLLKKDELDVIKILLPYVEDKIICLREPSSPLNLLLDDLQQSSKVSDSVSGSQNETQKDSRKLYKKIVCIDDSPSILQEMQRFLDRDLFKVTAVDDPIKAASAIFRIKPDLILMDITMPKINGYKLCSLLRASAYCSQTPIVMVTGNTGLIDKARAKLSGATDYLTKPFTKKALNTIVKKHL